MEIDDFDESDAPLVSEYQHRRILGATRAISCILSDLKELGVLKKHSVATGMSNGPDNIHAMIWVCAYRTNDLKPDGINPIKNMAWNPILEGQLKKGNDQLEKMIEEKNFMICEMGEHIKNLTKELGVLKTEIDNQSPGVRKINPPTRAISIVKEFNIHQKFKIGESIYEVRSFPTRSMIYLECKLPAVSDPSGMKISINDLRGILKKGAGELWPHTGEKEDK